MILRIERNSRLIALLVVVIVALAYCAAGTDDRMQDLTPKEKRAVVARWLE